MHHDQRPPRPSLFRALTLAERAAALRAAPGAGTAGAPRASERARVRLDRWRAQRPFEEPGRFAERLASIGLTEADLLLLLDEPDGALRARCPAEPPWLAGVRAALSAPSGGAVPTPEPVREYALAESLRAFAPLVERGRERLRARVAEIVAGRASVPFEPATAVELAYPALPPALVTKASRVLALEVNVARLRGELPGGSPEERFAAFFDRLATPQGLAALFDEYPVLARCLAVQVEAWIAASAELLERLCADFEALRATLFAGRDPGHLVRLDGGMGDTHRGGRSVQIVTFESGLRVVYKPRPLGADVRFGELLRWLDEHGQEPSLRAPELLDRGEHGWVEMVSPAPCADAAELTRFYERQGASLALLHALDAADFHHENVIAAGEHPLLVDLEVLFHPRFRITGPVGSVAAAGGVLDGSVLRIGLLPSRTIGGNGGRGVDLSGLGGGGGQTTPFAVPHWEARGTDEIFLGKKRVEVPPADNRPTLRGAAVDVLDFTGAILAGFERTYRLLLAHRDELLAPSGPLARFAGDEVRVILRPTAAYDNLLVHSYHPDMLRDALDRDRFLDRLWLGAGQLPHAGRVLAAEQADLLAGDIPLFTARPGSRDLFTSRGERIEGFLDEPPLASAHHRILGFSEADLANQVRFIRCSLATLRVGRDPAARSSGPISAPEAPVPPGVLDDRLLAAARTAGDELAATAVRTGDQVTWIGMTLVDDSYWMLAPLDVDLYSGLSGVALFLGALGRATGEERYLDLARGALNTMFAQIDHAGQSLTNIGAFAGWGGVVYALTRLGALWGDGALLRAAARYARRIPPLAGHDTGLDLVNGCAGSILALLDLHGEAPSADLLDAAVRCGERLLGTAGVMEQGIAWNTATPKSRPLCGLSHGATGMALALSALGAATGQASFRHAARAALAYESSLFSPEHGNWPDFRCDLFPAAEPEPEPDPDPEPGYMTSWCHGAAGMAHARLAMLGSLDGPEIRADIRAGIAATLREGFGRSHCLCHGDAGNVELLSEAARTLGDASLEEAARGAAAVLLDEIERSGYRCGVPSGVEAPGLMAGVAGIGYGFLRLARPGLVPPVLTLGSCARDGRSAATGLAA